MTSREREKFTVPQVDESTYQNEAKIHKIFKKKLIFAQFKICLCFNEIFDSRNAKKNK